MQNIYQNAATTADPPERSPTLSTGEASPADLLPEFECASGLRIRIHEQFGRWIVSTRGDVVLFRLRLVVDGKVEKEVIASQYVITCDQLTSRNWVAEVWNHLRGVNMNDFLQAFTLALELNEYEMDTMTYKPI